MSQPNNETVEDREPASPPPAEDRGADALVEQELLVEDVSIDGMCGVY